MNLRLANLGYRFTATEGPNPLYGKHVSVRLEFGADGREAPPIFSQRTNPIPRELVMSCRELLFSEVAY